MQREVGINKKDRVEAGTGVVILPECQRKGRADDEVDQANGQTLQHPDQRQDPAAQL